MVQTDIYKIVLSSFLSYVKLGLYTLFEYWSVGNTDSYTLLLERVPSASYVYYSTHKIKKFKRISIAIQNIGAEMS